MYVWVYLCALVYVKRGGGGAKAKQITPGINDFFSLLTILQVKSFYNNVTMVFLLSQSHWNSIE